MSSTPRMTQAERKAATRQALLRSAADVIAQRGYKAASVKEIAANAGYSIGALYSNFASKEALLLAAAEQNNQHAAALFALQAERPDSYARVARAWIEAVSENPNPLLLWIELWAQAVRRGSPLRKELAARSRSSHHAFKAMANRAARKAGVELSDEIADQLAALADAAGLGFAMRRLLDPDAVPPEFFEAVSERWLRAVLRSLAEDGGQPK